MKTKMLMLSFIMLMMIGCSRNDPQAYVPQQVQPVQPIQQPFQNVQQPQYAPAPVIVQQQDSPGNGFFTGMLMGHLMSGGGSGGSSNVTHNTTVVNKTYTTRPAYTPRPYSAPSRGYSSFRRR